VLCTLHDIVPFDYRPSIALAAVTIVLMLGSST
jgi:hypothetical protein